MPADSVLYHMLSCRQQEVLTLLHQRQATVTAIATNFGGDEGQKMVAQWLDSLCVSVGLEPPSGMTLDVKADDLTEEQRRAVAEVEAKAAEAHRRRTGR